MSKSKVKVLDLAAVYKDTHKRITRLLKEGACTQPGEPAVHDFGDGHAGNWQDLSLELVPMVSPPRNAAATCGKCRFVVSSDDTVTAAVCVSHSAGYPAFVLNFASKNLPGGAVASGVLAQEECLFRQTNLALAISPSKRPSCYPLPPGRVVLTRNIAVVRKSHPCYDWLTPPFPLVDVATSAAEQKPAVSCDGQEYGDPSEMRMRVISVLQAAARNGSAHLVLGAWGCGGFRNPARGLANIFFDVLINEGYARFFEYVEFAIPGEDSKHAVAFRAVFGDTLGPPLSTRESLVDQASREISEQESSTQISGRVDGMGPEAAIVTWSIEASRAET